MLLSKKAENISPSLTLDITAKANQMIKSGIDVVSFGAGEPDFDTPENIKSAAIEAIKNGKTKYTPVSGIKELKESIAKKFLNDNSLKYNLDQLIISTGAKQCLANAFMSILNPGDEVLIPVPYWVSYPELVKIAGGIPKFINLECNNSLKIDVEKLNSFITKKTKAIIINSPNNPTGIVYSKEDLTKIAEFAKENDLIIVSDEIYEKLIYENNKHISIASISQDAYNRTIVINGVSKAYAMTGWRIGYAAGNQKIIKLMNRVQSHTTSNPNSIAQYASVEALAGNQETVAAMINEFEARRNIMLNKLENIKYLSYIKPQGAFYVMVDISKLFGKNVNGKIINNSLDFCKLLLEHEKVAVIPGNAFGVNQYIRLSYATSREFIEKGLTRLNNFIEKYII